MECVLSTNLTEFMPEFAPLLPGAQRVRQLAELTSRARHRYAGG